MGRPPTPNFFLGGRDRPPRSPPLRPSPLKTMMHIKFPPISAKFINSPTSAKCTKRPSIFVQFKLYLLNLRFCASLYFDHDAFMHHTLGEVGAISGIFLIFIIN